MMLLCTEVSAKEYMDMALDDLLNLKIESASKKEEAAFDAPLSSTVITRQEILNSGATSIQEALRLAPGMIVREQSSGNFDIHIRGLDAIPPNSPFTTSVNTLTLVMIDNRPVYNYFTGGTSWETLPIDLSDVEKIEIIRGPSAALYGPNAVSGVINIITRKPKKEGVSFSGDAAAGNNKTSMASGALEYGYKDKFGIILSGNSQKRDRQDTLYYEFYRDRYFSNPSELYTYTPRPLSNPYGQFPEPDLSLDQQGANAFISFKPSDSISFDISTGLQDSRSQKIYLDNNATSFVTFDSQTKYADVKVRGFGFSGQISYLDGEQEPLGIKGWHYDFNTLDILLEYDHQWNKFDFRPGISYRQAVYDADFISGEQKLTTAAAFFRTEYHPSEAYRLIAAIRADQYNHPDKAYLSFQLGGTYNINPDALIRAVYARSSRSPAIYPTYLDYLGEANTPTSKTYILYSGNEDLELTTTDMLELGYRQRFLNYFLLDAEIFYGITGDYYSISIIENNTSKDGGITSRRTVYKQENLDLKAEQYGMTMGVTYSGSNNFFTKLFGTVQYTKLTDYAPNLYSEKYGAYTLEDMKHSGTPLFYGGIDMNYRPVKPLNINTNAYFYTGNTYGYKPVTATTGGQRQPVFDIPSKLLLNTKISYDLCKNASVYLNVRNLLNDNHQEFAWTDEIGRTILLGIHTEF
jgi:iron complex outermembrane receptor protein